MDRCPVLGEVRRRPRWNELRAIVAERAARILEAASREG
jgi:hypothetical protein